MNRILVSSIAFMLLVYSICWPTIINIPADYPTIQAGIDFSVDGDTVLVRPGTYVENVNFNGHNIVLGSLFLTTGNTNYISLTVIDGDSSGSVILFGSGEDTTAVLTGFTIRNGAATFGGGIFCYYSDPSIINNIILENTAMYGGAGICCFVSNSIIADNTIDRNVALPPNLEATSGGGIYCYHSNPLIVRNIIKRNICGPSRLHDGFGGGICCRHSNPHIYGNTIMENVSSLVGGGISCGFASPTIENNIIIGNLCGYIPSNTHGGAISCGSSSLIIRNNTIVGNTVTGVGGAIYGSGNDSLITNNICWDNSAPSGPELFVSGDPSAIIYNDIKGGWPGEGNIDCDPLFCQPARANYYLDSVSCCVGAGCDSLGNPDSTINIGALGIGCSIRCIYYVGDINGSDSYNDLDVSYGVAFLKGGNGPMCEYCRSCQDWYYCGDVNASCSYNGLDITYGVSFLKGQQTELIPCTVCPPAY